MTMAKRRKSYEPGHRPKFLVVVDDTPECDRALYFAARRAKRTGSRVTLLTIYGTDAFSNWFNVGSVMAEEAEAEAKALLSRFADRVRAIGGGEPELVVRQGRRADEIIKLIDEDEDIALLVLAAGTGTEGPGPLVSTLAGKVSGTFPIPLVVVPGHLLDEEIDALA